MMAGARLQPYIFLKSISSKKNKKDLEKKDQGSPAR